RSRAYRSHPPHSRGSPCAGENGDAPPDVGNRPNASGAQLQGAEAMTKGRQVQNTEGTEAGRHRGTSGVTADELSAMNREKALWMHKLHDDAGDTTRAAREAFHEKFVDEVDPARELPEDERDERAR